METRFMVTPETEGLLYGEKKTAEYIVANPLDIEVKLNSGDVCRPQDIRERIVRCRDCVHAIMSYRDGHPRCAGPMVMGATLVDPDGFCAWGEERGA